MQHYLIQALAVVAMLYAELVLEPVALSQPLQVNPTNRSNQQTGQSLPGRRVESVVPDETTALKREIERLKEIVTRLDSANATILRELKIIEQNTFKACQMLQQHVQGSDRQACTPLDVR